MFGQIFRQFTKRIFRRFKKYCNSSIPSSIKNAVLSLTYFAAFTPRYCPPRNFFCSKLFILKPGPRNMAFGGYCTEPPSGVLVFCTFVNYKVPTLSTKIRVSPCLMDFYPTAKVYVVAETVPTSYWALLDTTAQVETQIIPNFIFFLV